MEKYLPKEQHTRFLYPFRLEQNSVGKALKTLQTLNFVNRDNAKQVWEQVEKPSGIYQEEMLDRVTKFLFSGDVNSCGYLRVNKKVTNIWFKQGCELFGNIDSSITQLKMGKKSGGIELFLSHFGVGVLSITLTASNFDNYAALQQFNYCLSQEHKRLIAKLALPYADDDPFSVSPPTDSEPLMARLGKRGGKFDLVELRDFLLSTLTSLEPLFPKALT